MRIRRPSNVSSSVTSPCGPINFVVGSTSTIGSRRRAAAIASPSRVCAFSRTRNASSSAWNVLRSTTLGARSSSLTMSVMVLSFAAQAFLATSHSFAVTCFGLCLAPSHGGACRVGDDIDPQWVGRGLGLVVVMPVPPLVRRSLRVALWRVLPGFLTAERRHIEVAPGGPHGLVAAAVDEVCPEHLVAVADECIVAVPLVHAKVRVEAVGHGVPGYFPAHSRLHARDVSLWRARGVGELSIAGIQMGHVGDLIGAQGAAAAGVLGPAKHPGLEEGAVNDQLTAALKQTEQAHLALGSFELVALVHGHPRHPPAFGGQRVTGTCQGLLFHEELLTRSLPLLLRHDSGGVHRQVSSPVFLVSLFACCHLFSPSENL